MCGGVGLGGWEFGDGITKSGGREAQDQQKPEGKRRARLAGRIGC